MTFIGIDRRPEKPWLAVGAYPRAHKPWMALATQCAPGPCCGPVDEGGDFVWFGETTPEFIPACSFPSTPLNGAFEVTAVFSGMVSVTDSQGRTGTEEVRGAVTQVYQTIENNIELIFSEGCVESFEDPVFADPAFFPWFSTQLSGSPTPPILRVLRTSASSPPLTDPNGRIRVFPVYLRARRYIDPDSNPRLPLDSLQRICNPTPPFGGTVTRTLSASPSGFQYLFSLSTTDSSNNVTESNYSINATLTRNVEPRFGIQPVPPRGACFDSFPDPNDDGPGPGDDGPLPGDDDGVPPGDDDGTPSLRGGPGTPSRFSSNLNGFNPDDERRRTTQGGCCGTPSQP